MYPMLRFDTRLPRRPWHAWQHIYIWLVYPFMCVRDTAAWLADLKQESATAV
jgi:hypothetical protein